MIPFRQLSRNRTVETGFFILCEKQGFQKVIHIEDSLAENTKGGDEREYKKNVRRKFSDGTMQKFKLNPVRESSLPTGRQVFSNGNAHTGH